MGLFDNTTRFFDSVGWSGIMYVQPDLSYLIMGEPIEGEKNGNKGINSCLIKQQQNYWHTGVNVASQNVHSETTTIVIAPESGHPNSSTSMTCSGHDTCVCVGGGVPLLSDYTHLKMNSQVCWKNDGLYNL